MGRRRREEGRGFKSTARIGSRIGFGWENEEGGGRREELEDGARRREESGGRARSANTADGTPIWHHWLGEIQWLAPQDTHLQISTMYSCAHNFQIWV